MPYISDKLPEKPVSSKDEIAEVVPVGRESRRN